MKINEYLVRKMNDIVSFDLVEFNPLRDQERKTEQIALNILTQIITAAEKKKKWEQKTYY
jgi:arginase family enzyme